MPYSKSHTLPLRKGVTSFLVTVWVNFCDEPVDGEIASCAHIFMIGIDLASRTVHVFDPLAEIDEYQSFIKDP